MQHLEFYLHVLYVVVLVVGSGFLGYRYGSKVQANVIKYKTLAEVTAEQTAKNAIDTLAKKV